MSVFGIKVKNTMAKYSKSYQGNGCHKLPIKSRNFVALSHVKIQLHAFKLLVGGLIVNLWSEKYIQSAVSHELVNDQGIQTRSMANLLIGCKFNCNGSLYDIMKLLPVGNILRLSRCGGNVASELTLSCDDAVPIAK